MALEDASFYTTAGSRYFVGTTMLPTDSTPAAFELDEWTEVGKCTNFGTLGDQRNLVELNFIAASRVARKAGSYNAPAVELVAAHDPRDAGQIALLNAADTGFNINFKVELNDQESEAYSRTLAYYRGIVTAAPIELGEADTPMTRTFTISNNSGVFYALSELISSGS